MLRSLLSAAFLISLSVTSSAQNVIFQDGFESGLTQWTATGLWNAASSAGACMTTATPFPEGTGAAWYGRTVSCNYDNLAANSGGLELNNWITLPAGVASVTLYFRSWQNTESCWGNWDIHSFTLMAQNGPDAGFTQVLCEGEGSYESHTGLVPWHERRVDLTAYRGAQVRFRFQFDTGDEQLNETLGWLVDDVRIVTEPGQTFCPSERAPSMCPCRAAVGVGGGCLNSLGLSATLFSNGVASVSADTLTFAAADMTPGTGATLFQASSGTSTTLIPFGDGLLCLTGPKIRLGTRIAATGTTSWPHPALGPMSVAGAIAPAGGDYYYQVIYRDASPTHCVAATFNQTSAQRVTWVP